MKNSGKIFLWFFLTFCILNSVSSQQYWLRQPSPTTKWLMKCTFADSLYGWAVGDSGIVIHTSDGGTNWVIQNSTAGPIPIDDVFFLNRRLGWAVYNDYFTGSTYLLNTTNSGQIWNSTRFFDTTNYLSTVCFIDSLTGYLGSTYGKVAKTTNGGLNWNYCVIDSGNCYAFTMNKIKFLNPQTGFICGGHNDIVGEMWRTTNAGVNWSPACLTAEPEYDLLFHNGKITAVGGDFEYGVISLQTSDVGNHWVYSNDSCYGVGRCITMRTLSEFWVPSGFSGRWAVSVDSGKANSWFSIPAPDTSSVYAAQFTSPVNGWAFGTGGAIYKYNSGIIGIINNHNNVPLVLKLFQNYPNPFNPSTEIKFNISKAGIVTLKVFDILGREIKVLVNAFLERGEHSVNFDAGSSPSGVYFYRVESGNNKESKKMVLMK